MKKRVMHLLAAAKPSLDAAGITRIWYDASGGGWTETTFITVETNHDVLVDVQTYRINPDGSKTPDRIVQIIRLSKEDEDVVHEALKSLDAELFENHASFSFQSVSFDKTSKELVYPVASIIEAAREKLSRYQEEMQKEIDSLISDFGMD
jgi:hypothetical protein